MKAGNFTELVLEKTKMNLRSEVRKSYLSYAWWVLEPALMVSVFYVVFGILRNRGGPDFLAFLFCGYIPFLWFSRTVPNCSNSIVSGKGLINQIRIPKAFFPLVTMLHDAFKAAIVFLLLFVVLLILGLQPTLYWAFTVIIFVVQFLFLAACGLLVAMVVPFARDLKFLIATVTSMVMFSSGIFFDYEKVIIPKHQVFFMMNPMASLIANYREVLLYQSAPNWSALSIIAFISIIAIFIFLYMLNRLDGVYPRLVLE